MSSITDWIKEIGFYDKMEMDRRTVLLCGKGGSGKTTLAATFPNPFFLDADKGGASLANLHVPYVELHRGDKTHEVCYNILDRLAAKKDPFDKLEVKTLVFDSLTALGDFLLYESMKYPWSNTKLAPTAPEKLRPDQTHYGMVLVRFKNLIKYAQDLGLHIVATAGVRTNTDNRGNILDREPNLIGSYREIVDHDFDEVYYMKPKKGKDGKRVYMVYTTNKDLFNCAKTRSKKPPVPETIENPTFQKLFNGKK